MIVDVYHNQISECRVNGDPALPILVIQDNPIAQLDVKDLISCKGIDAGKNRLKELDVRTGRGDERWLNMFLMRTDYHTKSLRRMS